jgi:hypothetical protein
VLWEEEEVWEVDNRMNNLTKLVIAVTGLLVAVGTLLGTISMTLGRGPDAPSGVIIGLDSPEAYANFLANHAATG